MEPKISQQAFTNYDSIMCVYFCIEFIDFMPPNSKRLADFINLFSQKIILKNDEIIHEYFQQSKKHKSKKSVLLYWSPKVPSVWCKILKVH